MSGGARRDTLTAMQQELYFVHNMLADFIQAITDAAAPVIVNPTPLKRQPNDPELVEELLAPAPPNAAANLPSQAVHFAQLLTEKFKTLDQLAQQIPDTAELAAVDAKAVSDLMTEHEQLKKHLAEEQAQGEMALARVQEMHAVLTDHLLQHRTASTLPPANH